MATAPGYADISMQLRHTLVTRPAYLTFGVDPTATDPTAIGVAVSTAFSAAGSLKTLIDAHVSMTQVRVSLGTDGAEDIVGVYSPTVIGTPSITSLPPNCAVLVSKNTSRGGRRGKGRWFVPWCVDEGMVDEAGTIFASTRATMQTAFDTFLAQLATQNVPMVVLHGPSAPTTAHPTTPGAPNVVVSLSVDPLISTQRRRLGR
jgi:hypothetical protein